MIPAIQNAWTWVAFMIGALIVYEMIRFFFAIVGGSVLGRLNGKNGNNKTKVISNPGHCQDHAKIVEDITGIRSTLDQTGIHLEYIREKIDSRDGDIDYIKSKI